MKRPGEIQFIRELLDELASYVRERYADRTSVEVTSKSEPNDLLTEVDLAVQQRAMERIAQVFPGDLFLAEEAGMSRIPGDVPERVWLMDPIDGTQNFVRGIFPAFGISLAFAAKGEVVAGGVSLAIPGDLFWAERGSGAFRNGRRIHVSHVGSLEEARAEVDFGGPPVREGTLAAATGILRDAGQIRCHCAAVVGLCSVATGDMDAYIHVSLNPWGLRRRDDHLPRGRRQGHPSRRRPHPRTRRHVKRPGHQRLGS